MIAPSENPLHPASLAANGRQGADAETPGPCEAKHSPQHAQARHPALFAIDAAREHLTRYAQATDTPEWGIVEAADWLDVARAAIEGEP